eukprot:scaffold2424_cov62-Cyclotella_meneghiniana.AAC.8
MITGAYFVSNYSNSTTILTDYHNYNYNRKTRPMTTMTCGVDFEVAFFSQVSVHLPGLEAGYQG